MRAPHLLGTGIRPLVHLVRPDSRTIPGVVMADIWMKLRAELRRAAERKPSRPPLLELTRSIRTDTTRRVTPREPAR